ncbi:MAG: 1-deoxy-D-xylulose-5-phosphate synthase [Bacillota bacterium]
MYKFLSQINGPEDIKKLNYSQLELTADEIRAFLMESLSETGGHLASNLGTVELTIALHYYLNSPTDKIVWDVGHQAYTHKILTGRKDDFNTLRQKNGLSGYPKFEENEHDIIDVGHSSTSISSALGLALARDRRGEKGDIYAVIGDGAMTAGMAFEAMNHAGDLGTDFNVILNDNKMSIANNVGALSHYLSTITSDPAVNRLKEDMEYILKRIPKFGSRLSQTAERIKNGLKYLMISGVLFEELGFKYIGPIDGHNIKELTDHFKKAEQIKKPVLLHVLTRKGKGFQPAENNPSQYHGVSPSKKKTNNSSTEKEKLSYSKVFGRTMQKLAEMDEGIVGITAAMPSGTGLKEFADKYPDRYFDVGIAEQHAVTLTAGLARGGMNPVCAIYSTFLQRAYDQVIHDVCLQNLPLTIAVDRAGIVGHDGETHQGLFDFSFLRPIPNIVVMAPRDGAQLQDMLYTAVNHTGPAVLRYPRGEVYGSDEEKELEKIGIGKAEKLIEGEDFAILAVGSCVYPAQKAAEVMKKNGYSPALVDARFVKPLDKEMLTALFDKYDKIITAEEQVLSGGFGSAVLEFAEQNNLDPSKVYRIGIPDEFVPHGSMEEMRSIYEIDARGIVKHCLKAVESAQEVSEIWPKKKD